METTSLAGLTQQHLAIAQQASSGRSAHTVYGGHTKTLRQTLIALAGGQKLDEHENPGEATLQVLHGQVRLLAGTDEQEATTGELLAIPDARHSLEAIHDSVILLTVAKTNQP
jgi:quercetin dioxygenase-like cupin family protein